MIKNYPFYFVAIVCFALMACSDDDSFSTDPSNTLTFSVDTLCFDTVFSTVPTATSSFWVFNRSGDGLRIDQIRLKRGNQTGFRVNVDGVYLDNANGSLATDFEVRKGDSIRVFVELTSKIQDSDEPKLVEDDLLFQLESGVIQQVNLRAWSWDALLCDSIIVKNDTLINSSQPIVIKQGIRVDSGAVLTINAPTHLYFDASAGVEVWGSLVVNSTFDDRDVIFRGSRCDNMFDYLPYDRVSGQWQGIHFYSSSTGNILYHADIHSAQYGIICDSATYDSANYRLALECVTVHNCKGPGVETNNANIFMDNCQITNNLGDCVGIYGGQATIVYCTIAQFYPFDADRGVALRFTNGRNGSNYPLFMVQCYNTIITGYAEDEIMGETFNDDVPFFYYFSNCILRTPADQTDQQSELFNAIIWETPNDSVQGTEHFRTIDTDNLIYDFHLNSNSPARNNALILENFDFDRDNFARKDTVDIGCFQYRE